MIPTIDYLSTSPSRMPTELSGVERLDGQDEVTYKISSIVPDTSLWLEILAGDRLSWLRAFIIFPTFVQGGFSIDNPIRRLVPRVKQRVAIMKSAGGVPSSVTIYGAARSYGPHKSAFKALEIKYNDVSKLINMTMYKARQAVSVPLSLQYEYKPRLPSEGIRESKIFTGSCGMATTMYCLLDIHESFVGSEVTIEADAVERFCVVVGN